MFIFKRNINQKIWLSYIPAHRLQAFIDDPKYNMYKSFLTIVDKHIKVIKPQGIKKDGLYQAFVATNEDSEKFFASLCALKMDYNSNFKKRTGSTLEEYEKEHL